MLRIVEIGTELDLTNARVKEKENNDYLYILKYNNTFLLVDNGTLHYMSGIIEYTQEQYDALSTVHENVLYMVSNTIDDITTYSIYYGGTRIDTHTHDNKDVLDKFSQDSNGKLLYDGATIEGSTGGSVDLTEIQEQIDNLSFRSVIGEELDYGYFTMSTDQQTVLNNVVKFDTVKVAKNIDVQNGYINFKKGKTYEIKCALDGGNTSGYTVYGIYTDNGDVQISTNGISVSTNYSSTGSPTPISCMYTANSDCNIYIKIIQFPVSQTLLSAYSYISVQEIGRTHIVDPMDVKDDYIVEYGQFGVSSSRFILNSNIYFTRINGNITLNSNGTIPLKKGKSYSISLMGRISSDSGWVSVNLVNDLDNANTNIGQTCTWAFMSPSVSTSWSDRLGSYVVEPLEDINVCLKCMGGSIPELPIEINSFTVQEIAQPVVVEYNNNTEISNPLTTTDISQESPVGSIINYVGATTPEHYLPCDGSVYNVNDYPKLAEHIKNEYGNYNYFGGDGVTTFAVPNTSINITPKIDITPKMTSNTKPSPYVISTNSIFNSSFPAWKAFNNTNVENARDCWASSKLPSWIQIDFGKNTSISRLEITSRNDERPLQCIKSFDIQGSWDKVKFNTIKTISNEPLWFQNETRFYSLEKAEYRYYRINVTESHGGEICAIGLLKFFSTTSINCIKAEPTYYAVNQYGGFESKVLWEGSTQSAITVDNLDYWDYLVVYNSASGHKLNLIITKDTPLINHNHTYGNSYVYTIISVDFTNNQINYNISGNNTSWNSNSMLLMVMGYKGQLPTLLSGGCF